MRKDDSINRMLKIAKENKAEISAKRDWLLLAAQRSEEFGVEFVPQPSLQKANVSIEALKYQSERVASEIEKLPQEMADIFRLKYLEHKTWEQIAEIIPYSESQIFRIHKKGLELLS